MKKIRLFFKWIFSLIWNKTARKAQNLAVSAQQKRYVEIKCKNRRYWKLKKYILVCEE